MWDRDPDWTVYYSVGRMANHEYTKDNGTIGYRRLKANATWFKAICFDLDIGKKYATQKAGHIAVIDAVRTLGLPDPMVVSSGRGIHYYWPLITPIERAVWEETSVALRLALLDQHVEIDTSKIHDASMVLRPVGTSHKKQTPWRTVALMADAPDYELEQLRAPLAAWIGKAALPLVTKRPRSSVADAILKNRNLNIRKLAEKCAQLKAIVASGGEFDAAGAQVVEPLWRGTLGIAAYATDPEEAMMMLCQQHPDFDHAANMKKMEAWSAGPTTCAYFEQHSPAGCASCLYKGVASPASLNEEAISLPPAVAAQIEVNEASSDPVYELPAPYYVANGHIYMDVEVDVKDKDADGKAITKTIMQRKLVCPYEMHITGRYADAEMKTSTARLAVKYPLEGWRIHEIPMSVVTVGGRDFSAYLGDKQIILPSDGLLTNTRTFLMNYLQRTQALFKSGLDFSSFGWQENGTFLCGDKLIGEVDANLSKRLRGSAKQYSKHIKQHGDRDIWADTTAYIDVPNAEFLGVGLLTACMGALGGVSGAATPIISFYSPVSGTGKTLSLMIGSSIFMNPDDELMMQPKDTENAVYGTLGVMGDLSPAMDEMTMMEDDKRACDMAFQVSQGKEKKRLDRNAEERPVATWNSPCRVSTNKSLYDMYDMVMAKNEPARLRTFQFELHGREFVDKHGTDLYHLLKANYGWAMPELAQAVIDAGGREAVWKRGAEAFAKKFKFSFQSEERFFKNTCIVCYTMGVIGTKLGLFRFDLDRVINYMLQRVIELRKALVIDQHDAIDIVGQFLQEYNHEIIVARTELGHDQKVQFPVPDNASIRIDILYDMKTAVLPGSVLYVNSPLFKRWLMRNKDSFARVTTELDAMGTLLNRNQRVSMFKGCQKPNPGQTFCLAIDLTHPRMAVALNGGKPVAITSPAGAVLQPVAANAVP